jgi:hypothetical protein
MSETKAYQAWCAHRVYWGKKPTGKDVGPVLDKWKLDMNLGLEPKFKQWLATRASNTYYAPWD